MIEHREITSGGMTIGVVERIVPPSDTLINKVRDLGIPFWTDFLTYQRPDYQILRVPDNDIMKRVLVNNMYGNRVDILRYLQELGNPFCLLDTDQPDDNRLTYTIPHPGSILFTLGEDYYLNSISMVTRVTQLNITGIDKFNQIARRISRTFTNQVTKIDVSHLEYLRVRVNNEQLKGRYRIPSNV